MNKKSIFKSIENNYLTHSIKEAGITLVALVVTIIVLLILAGVTISLVLNDNGVMDKAQYASNTWANATKDEKGMMQQVERDIDELGEMKIKISDLKTDKSLSDLYGQTTDYESTVDPKIKWQLFYADLNNIYVIAKDYVENKYLPCSGNTVNGVEYGATDLMKRNGMNEAYNASFCSNGSYNDYVLTKTTEYKKGSGASMLKAGETTRNPLVSTYLRWVDAYPTNKNANICSCAYMMDTNKWEMFADGIDGAYAIGGPTMEMFVKSYNESNVTTHTNKIIGYEEATENNGWNNMGYQVKTEIDTNWNLIGKIEDLDTTNAMWNTEGNMWVITNTSKARGYWLAAPASMNTMYLRTIYYNGSIYGALARIDTYGFRPLVVIPKSAI